MHISHVVLSPSQPQAAGGLVSPKIASLTSTPLIVAIELWLMKFIVKVKGLPGATGSGSTLRFIRGIPPLTGHLV